METVRRVDRLLERIARGLCVLLGLTLVSAQLAEILLRLLGIGSATALFSLSPTVVLWLSLVGAILAQKQGRHVTLALLPRLLPPSGRRLSRLAGSLCGALTAMTLLWAGMLFVRGETALFGAQRWPVLAYPLFFALLLFHFLVDLAEIATREMTQDVRPPGRDGSGT